MKIPPLLKAGLTVALAACATTSDAAEIADTTLKWTTRLDGIENSMNNKLVYGYYNSEGGWTQVSDGDNVIWERCDILFDGYPESDWIHPPRINFGNGTAWTVKSFTLQNMAPHSYNWWMSNNPVSVNADINVVEAFTIKSSIQGDMGSVGDSQRSFNISAGSMVIDARADVYSSGSLNVLFGGGAGNDRNVGIKSLTVNNGLSMIGNAVLTWNGDAATSENPAFKVGGVLDMSSHDNKSPVLVVKFFALSQSNYSNETIDGAVYNTAHQYLSVKGLEGNGTITHNAYGTEETTFANIYLNNDSINDFAGTFTDTHYLSASRYTNFIKRGAGTQIIRVADGSEIKSIVTVEEGDFLIYNQGGQFDVEILSGARFGSVNAQKYSDSPTSEIDGNAMLKDLNIRDGGGLLVNVDNTSAGGSAWGHSYIVVGGKLSIEDSFGIYLQGNAGEGDVLMNILEWNSAYDAENSAQIQNAYTAGKINVYINGVQYNLANLFVGGNSADIELGAVIPEPAGIAVLIGLLSMAYALCRRRLCPRR